MLGRRQPRARKIFSMKWRSGLSFLIGIVVLVMIGWFAESAGTSTSASSMSGAPVRVDSISIQPNVNHGQTFVFSKALQLGKAELHSLTNLSEQSIQGSDDFYAWARNHGGVDPDQVHIQLVLSGNRDYEVRIIGMRAVGVCGPPLTGTMMAYGSEGGEESIGIGFNLDKDDPNAKYYHGISFGGDYFMDKTVSLKHSEQQAFEIVGSSLEHSCNFKIQLIILDGTRQISKTIGYGKNGNKSFSVSGVLPPTRYKAFYGGGIANSCPPHFEWMRIDPANPHC